MKEKEIKLPDGVVERFLMKPSMHLFYGRTITKDLKFDEWNEDRTVHQVLKNMKLTTTIEKQHGDEIKTYEKTTLKQELKEGMVVVWTPEAGYIIPKYEMGTMEEVIKEIDDLNKAIYG